MEDSTRERLVDGNIWLRGLHMLLFLIAYNIAEAIIVLLAIFQFLCALITGKVNEPLLRFGRNLSIYVEEIFEFLTFNSEIRPFPFEPWPDATAGGENWTTETQESAEPSPKEDDPVVINQDEPATGDAADSESAAADSNDEPESDDENKPPKS